MYARISSDSKEALARTPVTAGHCRDALRDGMIVYGTNPKDGVFHTRISGVARLLWSLLPDRKDRPIRRVTERRFAGAMSYEIDVAIPDAALPASRCDRRMDLRAAYLVCGSLSVPARGYHLEFTPPTEAAFDRLVEVLRAEGLRRKSSTRSGRQVVYFKDADEISQLLASVGASGALLALEDLRAVKETKNRIHRLVNTEAANLDRATSAAAVQRRAIAILAERHGLAKLKRPLRELAELRLEFPSDSLAELGQRCAPPVKKSTVNNRMTELLRLSKDIAPPWQFQEGE